MCRRVAQASFPSAPVRIPRLSFHGDSNQFLTDTLRRPRHTISTPPPGCHWRERPLCGGETSRDHQRRRHIYAISRMDAGNEHVAHDQGG